MKVLHACSDFSVLTETFIYDSILELQRTGVDNQVITRRRLNAETRPFPTVHVVTESYSRWPRLTRRIFSKFRKARPQSISEDWPRLRRQLAPCVEAISPDVLHAHFGPEAVLFAPLAEKIGCPLVLTFYGFDISKLAANPAWQEAYEELWPGVSEVIVLSDYMAGKVRGLGCPETRIRKVRLVRNLEGFRPSARRDSIRHFISVGRFVPKKGHADVVKAFARAAADLPRITLEIVGEGPGVPEIQSLVESLGISDRVKLSGALPSEAVLDRMSLADAFVLGSKTSENSDEEGTPTVLIEAQHVGLPCISTRHAGIPEMIPPESQHLLCKEGDIESMAAAMRALAESGPEEIRRMSEAGRNFVRLHHNIETEMAKLRSIYAEVASRGG